MNPLASTCRWAAAQRARESQRPDRLFLDPLARSLAGEEGLAMLEQSEQAQGKQMSEIMAAGVAIRTRFFDDLALRMAGEGIRQVVILAAGMDARAFRLSWPAGTTLYELDRPEVFDLKEGVLSRENTRPACRRVSLGVDLTSRWTSSLTAAGFVPPEPSLWLAEGFFFYLEEPEVRRVLTQVSELCAQGSSLGVELVSQSFFTSSWTQQVLRIMKEHGTPWRFGTDDPEGLLKELGWQARVTRLGDEGAHFGRWPFPVPRREDRGAPQSFLVVARRA